jgi:hypothetical protein
MSSFSTAREPTHFRVQREALESTSIRPAAMEEIRGEIRGSDRLH